MAISDDVEASFAGSLDHIARLKSRQRQLADLQADAEDQALHRIGRAYAAGRLTVPDVIDLHRRYRDAAGAGFTLRWDRNVPLRSARIATLLRHGGLPNQEDGSWSGQGRPEPGDAAPLTGDNVVYVLYDADWTPLYVGSTGLFRTRMKSHATEKAFTFWRAWLCLDRDDAYRRERLMLDEVMPVLNRRREGARTASTEPRQASSA